MNPTFTPLAASAHVCIDRDRRDNRDPVPWELIDKIAAHVSFAFTPRRRWNRSPESRERRATRVEQEIARD